MLKVKHLLEIINERIEDKSLSMEDTFAVKLTAKEGGKSKSVLLDVSVIGGGFMSNPEYLCLTVKTSLSFQDLRTLHQHNKSRLYGMVDYLPPDVASIPENTGE